LLIRLKLRGIFMTEVNPYQGPETNVTSPQGEGTFTLGGPHKVTVG
jgi:hypothetical protein